MSAIVIIPTYNERDNLIELTERLLALPLALDVVFVDDSSPDGTGKLADELTRSHPQISVIRREQKLGYGSAVIEGFRTALKGDYAWILQMDADLSHDPAAIPALIRAASDHDLVLGSRYIGGVRVIDWEIGRVLLSWMSNGYARAVTRLPVRDITTGFRCFRRQALEALNLAQLQAAGYGFQIEVAYRIWRSGGRLAEVPITFYGRQKGISKLSKRMIVEAAVLVWRLRLSRVQGI
ncbi:MAG: polyprenol monophosphomannose synthase [candidate division NC10 bacterium]|nr:polyprenol monophosphomannose synthase [candidate division NC10 bacterium]